MEWEEGGSGGSSLRVWDAAEAPVHVPKPVMDPLPSDSRFRQDLHALQVGMDTAPTSALLEDFTRKLSLRMQMLTTNYMSERAHIANVEVDFVFPCRKVIKIRHRNGRAAWSTCKEVMPH